MRELRGQAAVVTGGASGIGRALTEACGPISALLLLLTGRPAALPELSGSGAAGLRDLQAPSSAA